MGVKNFFPHPNELLIWAYPENLVEIGLLVEALDEFCRRAGDGMGGHGTGGDSIDNLSPSLWLLAWLGSALAEVCQFFGYHLGGCSDVIQLLMALANESAVCILTS